MVATSHSSAGVELIYGKVDFLSKAIKVMAERLYFISHNTWRDSYGYHLLFLLDNFDCSDFTFNAFLILSGEFEIWLIEA